MNKNFNKFYNRYRPAFAIAVVMFGIILVLILPLKLPYSVVVPGKIFAGKEWLLEVSSSNGQINTSVLDRNNGVTASFAKHQFDRKDLMSFRLKAGLTQGSVINAGDTVGFLQSSENELTLEQLSGEIEYSRAQLEQAKSGEKTSVIEEAKKTVEYAITNYEQLDKEYKRQKQLLDRSITSVQEYEIAERKAEAAKIAIEIAKAKLQSVTTGAKEQDIDVIQARLNSQENELLLLKKRTKEFSLVSPISGVLVQYGSKDTLLSVVQTNSYIAMIPLPVSERPYCYTGSTVSLFSYDGSVIPAAQLNRIEKSIAFINGKQVFLSAALLNNSSENLHGYLTECKIDCGTVSLWEYLKRKMNTLLRY